MTEPEKPSFKKFLGAITHKAGDPTFSVLKAHLIFEEVINAFLWKTMPNPNALMGARMSFAQRLAIARACVSIEEDDWVWDALSQLNRLRNRFAHHLQPKEQDAEIEKYVNFLTESLAVPLPYSTRTLDEARASTEPFYFAVDMVHAGLFGVLCDRLGLSDPDIHDL